MGLSGRGEGPQSHPAGSRHTPFPLTIAGGLVRKKLAAETTAAPRGGDTPNRVTRAGSEQGERRGHENTEEPHAWRGKNKAGWMQPPRPWAGRKPGVPQECARGGELPEHLPPPAQVNWAIQSLSRKMGRSTKSSDRFA